MVLGYLRNDSNDGSAVRQSALNGEELGAMGMRDVIIRGTMQSPFPGMDPYLERHWSDVHARLIYLACNEINRQLGGDLRARMGERVVVEQDFDPIRSIYPDVRVFEHGVGQRAVAAAARDVALAEPLVI